MQFWNAETFTSSHVFVSYLIKLQKCFKFYKKAIQVIGNLSLSSSFDYSPYYQYKILKIMRKYLYIFFRFSIFMYNIWTGSIDKSFF